MKNKYILPTVFLVIGLVGGFGGGYYFKTYQQSKLRSNFQSGTGMGQRFTPNGTNRGTGQQNRGAFGGGVEGEIISKDDKSITVKMPDGSTRIVLFSDTTAYSDFKEAKKSDLKEGLRIAVFGSSNTDGSLTAQRIQLNPMTPVVSPTLSK
jgi:hypothetical protein